MASQESGTPKSDQPSAMSRSVWKMRIDLNKHNIKVSQINPGLVETNFSMVRFKDDKERSKAVYKDVNPLVSEDIANVIDYVISSPENVNISDITVLAKSQASSTVINRD